MDRRAWLALLLIGSGEAAIAQTTAARPPSFGSAGRPSAVPVRQIGIDAAMNVNYDSNIFGVSDAVLARSPRASELQKSDVSLTPSLQLNIVLPFGRQSVFARGGIGYDFYLNNPRQNRERINLGLGADLQIVNGCSESVTGNYLRQRSNPGDVFFVPDPTDPASIKIVNDNTEEDKSIGVNAVCGGAIGITPGLGYIHSESRNSNRLFKLNDSNQDSFNGSLGYSRPSLGRVSIYGTYSHGTYPNRIDSVETYSVGGQFQRSIGSRISGTASLGYTWANPKGSPTPAAGKESSFSGSSYSLSLNVIPTERLSVDLLASKSAELSNSVFSTFSITEIYSINSTYKLNPRIDLNGGISYQTRDYRLAVKALDLNTTLSNDKFTRAYGGFVYNLNRRIRLNGLISQQWRRANNRDFRYSNTTASLGVSFSLSR